MRSKLIPVAVAALVLTALAASPAVSAKKVKFRAKPFVHDPGATGIVRSAWMTHHGLPDAGKSNHALSLRKNGTTATDASAGVAVTKVNGVTLTELGFDYQAGGHCGAGAPRFNVTTSDGTLFFFGCSHGDVTRTLLDDEGDSWNRLRFTDADAFPADGVSAWPGFGAVTVSAIHVVFDEGTDAGAGFVVLDNVDVNGKLMGKPGNSRN